MKAEILETVVRLNNEGAALLSSPSIKETKLAVKLFNEALSVTSSFDDGVDAPFGHTSTANRDAGINDLCYQANAPIPSVEDNPFYFFDQALHIRPETFVDHMGCNALKTIEFCVAIVLMNAALGCYQVAHECLRRQKRRQARIFFSKSLHFYANVCVFFTRYNPFESRNSKATLFFMLAAQNNYSLLCLRLGFDKEARLVQGEMAPLMRESALLLPADARRMVGEIVLNTNLFVMTNFFCSCPAAAA